MKKIYFFMLPLFFLFAGCSSFFSNETYIHTFRNNSQREVQFKIDGGENITLASEESTVIKNDSEISLKLTSKKIFTKISTTKNTDKYYYYNFYDRPFSEITVYNKTEFNVKLSEKNGYLLDENDEEDSVTIPNSGNLKIHIYTNSPEYEAIFVGEDIPADFPTVENQNTILKITE